MPVKQKLPIINFLLKILILLKYLKLKILYVTAKKKLKGIAKSYSAFQTLYQTLKKLFFPSIF